MKLRKVILNHLEKDTLIYSYFSLKNIFKYISWLIKNKPIPPPQNIKVNMIKHYQKKYNCPILIEGGTYYGETTYGLRNYFKRIYSIELNQTLHKKAVKRLYKLDNIKLLQGDSSKVLPKLLKSISEPCFFWLVHHFSGGNTSKGDLDTPIVEEIKSIALHKIKNHIIFIDDARYFNGMKGYPTQESLFDEIKKINHNYKIKIKNDIIMVLL